MRQHYLAGRTGISLAMPPNRPIVRRIALQLRSQSILPGETMRSAIYRCLAILLLIGAYVSSATGQATKESLTESELIAQVAGNSLSENIVHEIATRGLAFRPTDQYRSLITTAGGDALVLSALKNPKISDRAERTEANGTGELLQHLATAGRLIRSNQYQGATEELHGALRSNAG